MVAYGRQRIPGKIDPTAASSEPDDLVVSLGAAALWKLDDTGSTAVDATGSGHDGTITGATPNASGGPGGRGYVSFAGAGYVSVPYWSALNTTGGPFSAELWFRTGSAPAAAPNSFGLMYRGVSDLWGLEVRATRAVQAYFRYGASSYSEYASGSNAWALNAWTHLVYVKAGSSGAGTVYMNGAALGTLPSSGAVVSNTSDGLLLGAATTTTRRMTGDLSRCAWYPSALTAAQVAALYAASV